MIRSAAFSAIMMVGAFVLAETRTGMTEVSATRRLLMPFTLGGVSHVVKGDSVVGIDSFIMIGDVDSIIMIGDFDRFIMIGDVDSYIMIGDVGSFNMIGDVDSFIMVGGLIALSWLKMLIALS